MKRETVADADLRRQYPKVLEVGIIVSLVLHIVLFHALPAFDLTPGVSKAADVIINVEDIPPTEQVKRPPPPPRPAIPVPTESEDVPEDLTIESTELDLSEVPPPPSPDLDDGLGNYQFIPYDEPPQPIGGFASIRKHLVYPKIAAKAGVEGLVVVGVLIDEHGNVVKTQVLKSAAQDLGFEDAACRAVSATRWRPAKQRDMAVRVWVSVPVRFMLSKSST